MLAVTKFSICFLTDNSNKKQRTKYPPEFDSCFAAKSQNRVRTQKEAGAPSHLLTQPCLAGQFHAFCFYWCWWSASASHFWTKCTTHLVHYSDSLTTHSPNTESNLHRPHERSAWEQIHLFAQQLELLGELRRAAPPAAVSAKDTCGDRWVEKARTFGWALWLQGACNAEKRGHRNTK